MNVHGPKSNILLKCNRSIRPSAPLVPFLRLPLVPFDLPISSTGSYILICPAYDSRRRSTVFFTLKSIILCNMKFSFLTFCLAFPCLIQWVSSTPAGKWPNTVHFEITLTWEDWEVAGAVRKTILTNGQFPGPKLQLKQGDYVEFVVNNHLPFDTAVHFHGILLVYDI